jgi:dTDP-D-glucose 4,6-dehydratase
MDNVIKIIYQNNKNNKKLPLLTDDTINYIKTYTGEMKLRNGIYVKQIPKNDERYSILKTKPEITYYKNSSIDQTLKGFVWWKVNNKFMMITVFNNKKMHIQNAEDNFLHEYFYDDKHIVTRI